MPLPLDQQICFTLYATSMAINRTYKPLLDEMGITYPQYLVLCVLGEEGGATVGGIAARLALESSTVTPPVKRLEQAGLVKRKRNKTDERQVLVQLTAAGRQLLERASCLTETITKRSGMTDADIESLNARILALRAALIEPRGG